MEFLSVVLLRAFDICETVLKSSAAACEAAALIASARKSITSKTVQHEHKTSEDEAAKIAIFVCHCGEEIGAVVDLQKPLNSPNSYQM